MEKRNTMLLTVIAIATLLVAVIGATFAYFATTQNVDANIPVDVKTASAAATFTAVAEGDINISVDAYKMQEADAQNQTRDDLTDSASLNVLLTAAESGKPSECRYNVIWQWTSEQYSLPGDDTTKKNYFPTADVPKEFTIQGTATTARTTTGTTLDPVAETNIDKFPAEHKQIDISGSVGSGNTENFKEVDYFTIIRNAKIVVSDATGGYVKWTFVVRFYNSTKDQSLLMGKTFAGNISIDPDSVAC